MTGRADLSVALNTGHGGVHELVALLRLWSPQELRHSGWFDARISVTYGHCALGTYLPFDEARCHELTVYSIASDLDDGCVVCLRAGFLGFAAHSVTARSGSVGADGHSQSHGSSHASHDCADHRT